MLSHVSYSTPGSHRCISLARPVNTGLSGQFKGIPLIIEISCCSSKLVKSKGLFGCTYSVLQTLIFCILMFQQLAVSSEGFKAIRPCRALAKIRGWHAALNLRCHAVHEAIGGLLQMLE